MVLNLLRKFINRTTHLNVAILNGSASILLGIVVMLGYDMWWLSLLLVLNIISMGANLFVSWKQNEFNFWRKKKEAK